VGAERIIGRFGPEDSFLRHVAKARYLRNEIISHEVFRDKHETLSLTLQAGALLVPEGLDQYQLDKELIPSRDLPGICKLTWKDLAVTSLFPRHCRPGQIQIQMIRNMDIFTVQQIGQMTTMRTFIDD